MIIERTPLLDQFLTTVRTATPPRHASMNAYTEWMGEEIAQIAGAVAIEQYSRKHGPPSDEQLHSAGFVAGLVGALVTAAMYHTSVAPLLRTLRRYLALLTMSLGLLVVAGAYFAALGDAASFRAFSLIFFPGLIGVALTAVKGWKTWAEGRKALAEARKIEAEIS